MNLSPEGWGNKVRDRAFTICQDLSPLLPVPACYLSLP